MLRKGVDNIWRDRAGFVAAIMLKWNSTDDEGFKHYKFISDHFDTVPHDIKSNGVDDSVLLDEGMFKSLLQKNLIRTVTDEEAAEANKNTQLLATEAENARDLQSQGDQIEEANKKAKEAELQAAKDAGKNPQGAPTPVVIAPAVAALPLAGATTVEAPAAAETEAATAATKGKK